MRFALSDEQRLLAKSVADVLRKHATPADVRAAWSSDVGSAERWAQLADLGVPAMLVPEQHGGLGLSELDMVVVLEQVGRFALPEPVLETAMIVAPLLAASSAPEAAAPLARIVAGEITAAVLFDDARVAANLHGASVVVLARATEGVQWFEPAAGATKARRSVDGARRLGELCAPPTWAPMVTGDRAAELTARARDRAALGAAAELVGLGRAMLDMAVDYAKVREQFGKPIGSFQAVKHHLASAHVALELARPAVLYAAQRTSERAADASRACSLAKAVASDAATGAARASLQCHGAIGYSFEHDLHLWMKRTWALARAHGDAATQRARVAALILDHNEGRS